MNDKAHNRFIFSRSQIVSLVLTFFFMCNLAAFGQSSSSPFGSQPVFGQTNNANSNPFAPKPFGSTSPFGSQTGGSIFGSTSTGVFGAQSSSPLGSTSVFGASSSPAFGSSTPTFGASSGSAFGNSSSPFGGKCIYEYKQNVYSQFLHLFFFLQMCLHMLLCLFLWNHGNLIPPGLEL